MPRIIQLIAAPWDKLNGNDKKLRTYTMYALRDDGEVLCRRYESNDDGGGMWVWESDGAVEKPE